MPLTPDNMESRVETWVDYSAAIRDITKMDRSQLGVYTERAFIGMPNREALPSVFWDLLFDSRRSGVGYIDYQKPGPEHFFAHLHDMIGSVHRGTIILAGEVPDLDFRPNLRAVLLETLVNFSKLADKGNFIPTGKQNRVATRTIRTARNIKSVDAFINECDIPVRSYPQALREDLIKQGISQRRMLDLAERLALTGKFGPL